MEAYRARLQEFDNVLTAEEIDLKELQTLCFSGIPDEGGKRSLCWRLLLNYLPTSQVQWEKTLATKRDLYKQFINELVLIPGSMSRKQTDDHVMDHPLNPNPESEWSTFFKDNDILLQIDKDVRRLCPDISFFQQPTDFPCTQIVSNGDVDRLHVRVQNKVLNSANVERKGLGVTRIARMVQKAHEDYAPLQEGSEAHWEVVERILFVYAKLNPGQGYVQGMNEIIGPIYFTFASDPNAEWRAHAEADTFFCFTNLMAEIRDFFIKTLDESESGINTMIKRLMEKLRSHDPDVWETLHKQQIHPQFFSFRWLTLLLSQEFPLPDVLRIWDSLLADSKRFSFLIDICCAMILVLHNELINGDFPSNMKLLQNFPSMDIVVVLSRAAKLANGC